MDLLKLTKNVLKNQKLFANALKIAFFVIVLSSLTVTFQNCGPALSSSANIQSASPASMDQQVSLSCAVGGITYAAGTSIQGFPMQSAAYPTLCGDQVTKTCESDGQFDGPVPLFSSCNQLCLNPDTQQPMNAGTQYSYYTIASAASTSACEAAKVTATCSYSTGLFSPSVPVTRYSSCLVAGQTCAYPTGSEVATPSGHQVNSTATGYRLKTALFPNLCGNQQTSTCQSNGTWTSAVPLYTSCTQQCLHPDSNQPVPAGTVYTYYTLASGTADSCNAALVTTNCSSNSGQFSPLPASTRFSTCSTITLPTIARIIPPAPKCNIQIITGGSPKPARIKVGESVTFFVRGEGAYDVFKFGDTDVPPVGIGYTFIEKPTVSRSYTASISGVGGASTCVTDIIVDTLPVATKVAPSCYLESVPHVLRAGESSTLVLRTWGYITSASVNGKAVNPKGDTVKFSPNVTSEAKATVTGPGGSSDCSTNTTIVRNTDFCSPLPMYAAAAAKTVTPIRSQAELLAVQPGGNYLLMNDLTLSGEFPKTLVLRNSIFDGGGKTISGLVMNPIATTPNEKFGLFSSVENSFIKNLTIANGSITATCTAGCTVGLLVGQMESGRMCNVAVSGIAKSLSGTQNRVGGLVGVASLTSQVRRTPFNELPEMVFYNVSSSVDVSSNGGAGGLFGGASIALGGISYGLVIGASATGPVLGANFAGGLSGSFSNFLITDSKASGTVNVIDQRPFSYFVGGFTGSFASGSILNSSASGSVGDLASYVGGLIGASGVHATIINSEASGRVTAISTGGGLIGSTTDTLTIGSRATGDIFSNPPTGGLHGYSENSAIIRSFASGHVHAVSNPFVTSSLTFAGGLVGTNVFTLPDESPSSPSQDLKAGLIENSYATGAVIVEDNPLLSNTIAGGLVGYNNGGSIDSCYSTTLLSPVNVALKQAAGGLIGKSTAATLTDSYWDLQTSGSSTSPGGGDGKSTAQMKRQDTFVNWDFLNVWTITNGYPTLRP